MCLKLKPGETGRKYVGCWLTVDETSARRGHRYVTNFVDPESKELLFMTEGRSHEALEAFALELRAHQGDPSQIELICMDMSPAFRKGAWQSFPQARIVTDLFHLMQMADKALNDVRATLRRDGAHLPGSRWAIRGNEWTRSDGQLHVRKQLCRQYPKLGRTMMLTDLLQDILKTEDSQHVLPQME
jgi:transposase